MTEYSVGDLVIVDPNKNGKAVYPQSEALILGKFKTQDQRTRYVIKYTIGGGASVPIIDGDTIKELVTRN